jgi:hypothetical protein
MDLVAELMLKLVLALNLDLLHQQRAGLPLSPDQAAEGSGSLWLRRANLDAPAAAQNDLLGRLALERHRQDASLAHATPEAALQDAAFLAIHNQVEPARAILGSSLGSCPAAAEVDRGYRSIRVGLAVAGMPQVVACRHTREVRATRLEEVL